MGVKVESCCAEEGPIPSLDSLIRVSGGSVATRGLVNRDGFLHAVEADPWLLVDCDNPSCFAVIEMRFPEGYEADGLVVYYSLASDPGFSEERTVRIAPVGGVFLTRVLSFAEPVVSLRLDPGEKASSTGITLLRICVDEAGGGVVPFLCGRAGGDRRCLVVTHDLTKTGAPLLARRIAEELASEGVCVAALCVRQGDGDLARDYWAMGLPLLELDSFVPVADDGAAPSAIQPLLSLFIGAGYEASILNTVVSARLSSSFKSVGMRVVSLIHETRETMVIHGMEDMAFGAAEGSDALVFPAESVRDGFMRLVSDVPGAVHVRPQGVYLSDACVDDDAAQELLANLGVGDGSFLVLGSGTPEMRKGFDLFVAEALLLKDLMPEADLHFVWTGQSQKDGPSREYLCRLENQVEKSAAAKCFHLLEFLDAPVYSSLLNRADVFWCTSRDDTFPSVVLEAMQRCVPVVAYADTGGVDVMLAEGRGLLVEGFSPGRFAECTRDTLLATEGELQASLDRARAWILDELRFDEYVRWVGSLTAYEAIPVPEAPPVPEADEPQNEAIVREDDLSSDETLKSKKKRSWPFFK